jgi:hypothetical protein
VSDDEDLSARDRAALSLWRAPEPPPDFAPRVLRRLSGDRGVIGRASGLAVAAAAIVLVGVCVARLLAAPGVPPSAAKAPPSDGGLYPEVVSFSGAES